MNRHPEESPPCASSLPSPEACELRDIAVSFSDALRKDKAASFSFIARRT